MTQTRL